MSFSQQDPPQFLFLPNCISQLSEKTHEEDKSLPNNQWRRGGPIFPIDSSPWHHSTACIAHSRVHLSPYPFSPHVFTEGEDFLSWKNKGYQGWRGNRRLTLQRIWMTEDGSLGDRKPFKGRTRQYFWKINSSFVYSTSVRILFIWMSLIYNLVIWKGTGSSLLFHYLRWKKLCSKNDQPTALGLLVIH